MIDSPTRSDAANLSDEQLLEKLLGFGLEVDRAELERRVDQPFVGLAACAGGLSVAMITL